LVKKNEISDKKDLRQEPFISTPISFSFSQTNCAADGNLVPASGSQVPC